MINILNEKGRVNAVLINPIELKELKAELVILRQKRCEEIVKWYQDSMQDKDAEITRLKGAIDKIAEVLHPYQIFNPRISYAQLQNIVQEVYEIAQKAILEEK